MADVRRSDYSRHDPALPVLQQFTLACMLAVVVTAVVSALLPAVGTYHEYDITPDLLKFKPKRIIWSSSRSFHGYVMVHCAFSKVQGLAAS